MKKNVTNHEQLLKDLALQGDSHAFFSLISPYLQSRYLKEREQGADHQSAQTRILADALELLEGLQKVTASHFDAWLEGHFTQLPEDAQDGESDVVVLDKGVAADAAAFLGVCNRELVRTGSVLKQRRKTRNYQFPHILLHNKILFRSLLVTAIVAVPVMLSLVMIKFQIAVELSFITKDSQYTLRYPFPSMLRSDTVAAPPLNDSVFRADSAAGAVADSSDTARAEIRQPSQSSVSSTVPVKRGLPPVKPKARLNVPPPPPVSTSLYEESVQSEVAATPEPVTPVVHEQQVVQPAATESYSSDTLH